LTLLELLSLGGVLVASKSFRYTYYNKGNELWEVDVPVLKLSPILLIYVTITKM